MGCATSRPVITPNQTGQHEIINKTLDLEKKEQQDVLKLLLLGAGECGKSTILKQIKILHNNGFSEQEIEEQKFTIYSNIVMNMVLMLKAMNTLQIPTQSGQDIKTYVDRVYEVVDLNELGDPPTEDLVCALEHLWKDWGVKRAYERRAEYHLPDCAAYFLDNLHRIGAPSYIPSNQDLLYCIKETSGVVTMEFTAQIQDPKTHQRFRVVDVAGQRSERRKWIHCFDNVDCVIFIAAINEFDQVLFEDAEANRLHEALDLFASICNNQWFIDKSMILFLNKKDLFEDKISRGLTINECFPNYLGPSTYEDTTAFIQHEFISRNQSQQKQVYSHFTCATDTGQVEFVIDSVIKMVFTEMVNKLGLS